MRWPVDHPALTDPDLARWRDGADELCPNATVVSLLRHVPNRRVTSLIDLDGEPAVLKLFASPRARGNHRRLTALAETRARTVVPMSLGADRAGRVGLVEFTDGTPFHELDDAAMLASAAAVGATLRILHESGPVLDRSWTVADELAQLERRATPRTQSLLARLTAAAPQDDQPLVASHRDFHPKQVVVTDEGAARLIDLDDAAMAPAGLDIGNFLAHLDQVRITGRRRAEVVERAAASFVAGYGALPADTDQWRLLALARLAGLAESRHGDAVAAAALAAGVAARLQAAPPAATDRPQHPVDALRRLGHTPTGWLLPLNERHPDRPVTLAPTTVGPIVLKELDPVKARRMSGWMTYLWSGPIGASRSPAGIPEPLGYAERFLAMRHVPGAQLAARGELPPDRSTDVAALLADLHRTHVPGLPLRDGEAIVRSLMRKVGELPEVRRRLFAPALALLAGSIPTEPKLVTTHGDWAPRNIIATADRLTMIDLDRLQLADPARDVAYYGAWLFVTQLTLGKPASWALGEELAAAYARARPDSILAPTMAFHRVAALIRIVHGWSALATDDVTVAEIAGEAQRLAGEWAAAERGHPMDHLATR